MQKHVSRTRDTVLWPWQLSLEALSAETRLGERKTREKEQGKGGNVRERLKVASRARLRLRSTPECIRHNSKPNVTRTCDKHKTSVNKVQIDAKQPNETQTTNLANRDDENTQPRTRSMPKTTTTYKDPPSTRLIEPDRLRATLIEPTHKTQG